MRNAFMSYGRGRASGQAQRSRGSSFLDSRLLIGWTEVRNRAKVYGCKRVTPCHVLAVTAQTFHLESDLVTVQPARAPRVTRAQAAEREGEFRASHTTATIGIAGFSSDARGVAG